MQVATLKKAAEELGISLDDLVSYHRKGHQAFIQIDLKLPSSEIADRPEPDVFDNILAMAEDVGIRDWSLNHDHYLYGIPSRKD